LPETKCLFGCLNLITDHIDKAGSRQALDRYLHVTGTGKFGDKIRKRNSGVGALALDQVVQDSRLRLLCLSAQWAAPRMAHHPVQSNRSLRVANLHLVRF
jgi:hypothetical protein